MGRLERILSDTFTAWWSTVRRNLVKEIINNCPVCCIRRAQPIPPIMGTLPKERLSPHKRPFTFTGVDYFGPIEVAKGRRRENRWGVLFTCLTVRTVHLELVPSLSTDSFLLALKLFTARRGVLLKLLSDNEFSGSQQSTRARDRTYINVSSEKQVSGDVVYLYSSGIASYGRQLGAYGAFYKVNPDGNSVERRTARGNIARCVGRSRMHFKLKTVDLYSVGIGKFGSPYTKPLLGW